MLIGTTFTHVVSRQNELVGPPTFKKRQMNAGREYMAKGESPSGSNPQHRGLLAIDVKLPPMIVICRPWLDSTGSSRWRRLDVTNADGTTSPRRSARKRGRLSDQPIV